MKLIFTLFLILAATLQTFAQTTTYTYDASGNRTSRTIMLPALKSAQTAHTEGKPQQNYNSELGDLQLSIYPNPTAGELHIHCTNLPADTQGSIVVYDLQGRTLQQLPTIEATNTINLATAPAGTYIVRIQYGRQSEAWRVVRQ